MQLCLVELECFAMIRIKNFKLRIKNSERGFTLLELLVVIAIIGILASLLVVNFINVRERSRDAQRKSNLRQIQSALELYRADTGEYPASSPGLKNCPASGTKTDLGNTACSTVYMKSIPRDPSCPTTPCSSVYNGGNYYYGTLGTGYQLVVCLENANEQLSDVVKNTPLSGYTPSAPTTNCSSSKYYVLTDL